MFDEPHMEMLNARIERLINVLSLLSLGEYDPALSQIEVGSEGDNVAVLEQALALFVQELADAREESSRYLAEVEQSKREMQTQLETITRQQIAITELSTPIIELWDDVLTLPIVGLVDTQRSIEMTDRLLERISSAGARCVIIDLTGIDIIDTATANHFLEMIRAAELLGAHCVITGMSAHTSQTMVSLGIDLGGVRTLRSLKEGLGHSLRYLLDAGRRERAS